MAEGSDQSLDRLVRQAARGDDRAFAALINRFERTALATAYAILRDAHAARDVAQECFLKAWQRLLELKEPARFAPWLCGIARNLAIDHRRRQRPAAAPPESTKASAGGPETEFDRLETAERIDRALDELDDLSRTIVVLRYYEDLSSKDIAQIVDLSPAAVDMRLSRARQELRHRLSADVADARAR